MVGISRDATSRRPRGLTTAPLVSALVLALATAACEGDPASPPAASSAAPSASPTAASGPSTGATSTAAPPASPPAAPTAAAAEAPPQWITAQHILVAYKGAKNAPKGVTRSKADAKKRAEEVIEKAKQGDFSALVKDYSDDPGSADRLGNLGKFERDKMVKPFSDAAFALKVGEVSGAVETPFGFHVIKRNQ